MGKLSCTMNSRISPRAHCTGLTLISVTDASPMPMEMSIESNHHVTDNTHDFRQLVNLISSSIHQAMGKSPHAASDDVVDLGEGNDADGGFAKQAELMKQQLHNQNQKQSTQVDGPV